MSRASSTSCALIAATAISIGAAREARAQACCGGSSALSPARLEAHESVTAGITMKMGGVFGSFDGRARFAGSPKGAREIDLEQDLLVALRVLGRGQISISMPLVETWRRVQGVSEVGGGLGDTQIAARWDFLAAGAHAIAPGVALTATMTLPTGLAPERSSRPLATDATGSGAWQGAFGAAIEQIFGHVLVNLTGALALRSARDVNGIHAALGPAITVFAAAGWLFDGGRALVLTTTFTSELDGRADGVVLEGSGKRLLRLGLTGGLPLGESARLQGGIFVDPPMSSASKNEPASAGMAITVLRAW